MRRVDAIWRWDDDVYSRVFFFLMAKVNEQKVRRREGSVRHEPISLINLIRFPQDCLNEIKGEICRIRDVNWPFRFLCFAAWINVASQRSLDFVPQASRAERTTLPRRLESDVKWWNVVTIKRKSNFEKALTGFRRNLPAFHCGFSRDVINYQSNYD